MRINQFSPVNTATPVQGMDSPQNKAMTKTVSIKGASSHEEMTPSMQAIQTEETSEESSEYSEEILKHSITQANKSLAQHNRVVERSVHDVTKTVMYTVRDTVTQEVIAEFPPKRIQDMIAKMWELAGLFVDEKA